MQASPTANGVNGNQKPPGIGVEDILFTLFRHKELILAGLVLGVIGAGTVRLTHKPYYVSETELNVPYIKESLPIGPVDPDQRTGFVDPNGQTILATEARILTSFDVSSNAA